MKKCSNPECESAGQLLPLDEFTTQNQAGDGKAFRCKTCVAKYRKTNSAKTSSRKYRQSEKGKAVAAKAKKKYRQTENGRAVETKYSATKNGRAARNKASKKYQQSNPEKEKAKGCVRNAIRNGEMLPVSAHECADCGKQAEHHHHESYAEKDWLNVTPLCVPCHRERHRLIKQGDPQC